MYKILTNSTTKAQLCSHAMLVSLDEIEKAQLAFVGEKPKALSISPTQSLEVQPTLCMVVYQRKDTMHLHISTKIPTITIIKKERTPIK